MNEITLNVKRVHLEAKLPSYVHFGDAGADLFADEALVIYPGERITVRTGIKIEIPSGFVGLIWDKSGISSKYGVKVFGGVIDSGYRGEILVILMNVGLDQTFFVEKGDKIAQLLIQPIFHPIFKVVDELSDTNRGSGGFGSTG